VSCAPRSAICRRSTITSSSRRARAGPFLDKLLAAIEPLIDSLSEMPARGALPRDPIVRARGYRMLVHGPYLIFYKLAGRQVRVYRVLRGNRAYRDFL
jgi:plasmid stabilization system protein ParE